MNIYPSIDIVLHAKSHNPVLKGFLQQSETYRVKYYLLSQEAHPEQALNAHDAMQHLAQHINPLRSPNGQRNHIEPILLGIAPEISFYLSYISAEEGNFGFCMLLNRDMCKNIPTPKSLIGRIT